MSTAVEGGTLYLVSTPIGNLSDITLRALDVLAAVDLIAAEDTRYSKRLLLHFQIGTPLVSFHEHNERARTPQLIGDLQAGKSVALISDAGTPAISDPGFPLIRAALANGIAVQAIPGATAFVPALQLSGLPIHRFAFEGFPPAKKGRQTFFRELQQEERTIVLYESPHRLIKTLEQLLDVLGDRHIAVVRELTKKFEQVLRGTLTEVLAQVRQATPKGEIVLVVAGAEKSKQKVKKVYEN